MATGVAVQCARRVSIQEAKLLADQGLMIVWRPTWDGSEETDYAVVVEEEDSKPVVTVGGHSRVQDGIRRCGKLLLEDDWQSPVWNEITARWERCCDPLPCSKPLIYLPRTDGRGVVAYTKLMSDDKVVPLARWTYEPEFAFKCADGKWERVKVRADLRSYERDTSAPVNDEIYPAQKDWFRYPRDFSPAFSVTNYGDYYKIRTGTHTTIGNIPKRILKRVLNSSDYAVLDRTASTDWPDGWPATLVTEMRKTFARQKIVSMMFFEALRFCRDFGADTIKAFTFHEDGRPRRLRWERETVRRQAFETVVSLANDGWSAFIEAKRLEPFAWYFLHGSEPRSSRQEIPEKLHSKCECEHKSCRLEKEDGWLTTTDKQTLEIIRRNAAACVICRKGKRWKACWFTEPEAWEKLRLMTEKGEAK